MKVKRSGPSGHSTLGGTNVVPAIVGLIVLGIVRRLRVQLAIGHFERLVRAHLQETGSSTESSISDVS